MTVAQRWRFRRDLVVWVAVRRGGLSSRYVGDAMGLSKSRVLEIVAAVDRSAGTEAGAKKEDPPQRATGPKRPKSSARPHFRTGK